MQSTVPKFGELQAGRGFSREQLIDGFLGHRSVIRGCLSLFYAGAPVSTVCLVSESHKKPHRSPNAVFLYVPMETCKSFRDSTALDGTEWQKSNSTRAACSPLVMPDCCIAKECFCE